MCHSTDITTLPLPQIALRMLVDLNSDTADPDSDLPSHLEYAIETDVHHPRVRICVFGFRDAEIYAGPATSPPSPRTCPKS